MPFFADEIRRGAVHRPGARAELRRHATACSDVFRQGGGEGWVEEAGVLRRFLQAHGGPVRARPPDQQPDQAHVCEKPII